MSAAGPHWWPAYIGIGSNLESPVNQVRSAIDELARVPQSVVANASPLYRSVPMGPSDQPDFVNAVAAVLTQLSPEDLLQHLIRIEDEHGRCRDGEKWGPRTLDLDLLVYAGKQSESASLTLPHPGIVERNFVLLPLNDVAPFLQVPSLGNVAIPAAALSSNAAGIDKIDCDNESN